MNSGFLPRPLKIASCVVFEPDLRGKRITAGAGKIGKKKSRHLKK